MDIHEYKLQIDQGPPYEFSGQRLGEGSSKQPWKKRWFEVDIYLSTTGSYVLHTAGRSEIPGETTRYRLIISPSAFEIVERLVVNHGGNVYVPTQSLRAITAAAQFSDDMLEALREIPNIIEAKRRVFTKVD